MRTPGERGSHHLENKQWNELLFVTFLTVSWPIVPIYSEWFHAQFLIEYKRKKPCLHFKNERVILQRFPLKGKELWLFHLCGQISFSLRNKRMFFVCDFLSFSSVLSDERQILTSRIRFSLRSKTPEVNQFVSHFHPLGQRA